MRLNHPFLLRRTLLSFLLLIAPMLGAAALLPTSLQAAGTRADDRPAIVQRQVFYDNLRVHSGQVIEGDVVVYQGNVTVEKEGAIHGDLIVYSGNVQIERGGVVSGNVTALSGNVTIDGAVGGSVTAWRGNVSLGGDAVVDGDISVVSGAISQARGSVVRGNVVRGPAVSIDLPPLPGLAAVASMPLAPKAQPPSAMEIFLGLIVRTLRALLLLGVAVGIGALLMLLRPAWVEQTRATLIERTPLSFAAGLIFNLFGLALIGLLWITVCFRPPAVLLGLALAALNLGGLAALGEEMGRRIEKAVNVRWNVPARTAVGIVVLGALIAFFWILGGCLSFFAYLIAVIVGSLGVGAILVQALRLGERAVPAPTSAAAQATPAPAPATSPAEPESSKATEPEETPAVQSLMSEPLEPVAPSRAAEETSSPEAVAHTAAASLPVEVDDFTQINGVGPVFDRRLKEAGILTFEELARRPAAEIAEIIQWPVGRVVRTQIIEQAQELAQRKKR